MPGIISWVSVLYILLVLNSQKVDGCSCPVTHPQTKFCNSDYVIIGRVQSETRIPGPNPGPGDQRAKFVYSIEILSALKGINSPAGSNILVETPDNPALCGVRFQIGQTAFFGGNIDNGSYKVNGCGILPQANQMTSEQSLYFFTNQCYSYSKNCRCQIGFSSDTSIPNNACVIPSSGDRRKLEDALCYNRHGLCKKSQGGTCSWENAGKC